MTGEKVRKSPSLGTCEAVCLSAFVRWFLVGVTNAFKETNLFWLTISGVQSTVVTGM